MENRIRGCIGTTTTTTGAPPLHTAKHAPQTAFNRVFTAVYSLVILSLILHHTKTLLTSTPTTSPLSFFLTLSFLISDLVLAFIWSNTQVVRMHFLRRQQFPENLERVMKREDIPGLDVFICTADPYKEPPMGLVNTALSVMAYEYPAEKISVYVSDDGGSAVTLFALMEAAKFATLWLPFCKENHILDRNPEVYFRSNHHHRLVCSSEVEQIKMMYECMKKKVEHVLDEGKVGDQYINGDSERGAFEKWTHNFTKQDHPSVLQVLSDASKSKDVVGNLMPNLIYVSRQKSKISPQYHFKAGALNVLLRVSALMTNASIILIIDCDMYSNNPQTPLYAICYLCDSKTLLDVGYVQFPQCFRGINKKDIYAGEYRRLFQILPTGFDGLRGPNLDGTGCFLRRRAFFGGPSTQVSPEIHELGPDHVANKSIQSPSVLAMAHHVANCTYENQTNWGSKVGFRYGSLVEDYFTGLQLKCEGWRSIFCNPERTAFYGDTPISLVDVLNQQKRWAVGLLEVGFCTYSPATFGVKSMGLLGLVYGHYSFWPLWSIPVSIYAFVPQLTLLNKLYIFPEASEPWFLLYVFLFLGAYGQDLLDFVLTGGTVQRWWNDQRFWLIRSLTSNLFGSIEFLLKTLHVSRSGFGVTSKVLDYELRKRYEQGKFEFGVHSPMFVTLATAALINLMAFLQGLVDIFRGNNLGSLFAQMCIASFGVVNCWPIYEAMALRRDAGKMHLKTTSTAICLAMALYISASLVFN